MMTPVEKLNDWLKKFPGGVGAMFSTRFHDQESNFYIDPIALISSVLGINIVAKFSGDGEKLERFVEDDQKTVVYGRYTVILSPGLGSTHIASDFPPELKDLDSMILTHYCSGVDISSKEYVEGTETLIEAMENEAL